MSADASDHTFFLVRPLAPDALKALRDDVLSAARAGTPTIDLDGVGLLDSASIAALISILRDVRSVGADVVLRVGRKSIVDTLRITGLDKVFTIVAPGESDRREEAEPAQVRPRRSRRRFVASFTGSVLALMGLVGFPVSADSGPSAHDVVARIASQNPAMQSYQAQVSVDFHLQSFPYLSQHLDGTTYFKRPDNYEVVFSKVPSYAKGFDKLYSDIGDPTDWERRFDLSVVGERTVDGHRDVVLRMVQKVRGMIDHEDVAVDASAWRVDDMEWHYYNGGTIAMSQRFEQEGPFTVLAGQNVTIRIPFVHAAAVAKYSDYRTNVAIDDAVFTKDKKP